MTIRLPEEKMNDIESRFLKKEDVFVYMRIKRETGTIDTPDKWLKKNYF